MTAVTLHRTENEPSHDAEHASNRREGSHRPRWLARTTAVLLALAGGAVFSYPLAAPWISDLIQRDEIIQIERKAQELDPEVRERLLDEAHRYNADLPDGPLRDPYVVNEQGLAVSMNEARDAYDQQLVVDPDAPDAAIARITIPEIGVDLPIFHGTDDETLSKGVGHFYGSGLPVGGEGVHSVLTAHSGYVDATLFDRVSELEIGDTFTVTVLGEVLTYEVDNIATVLPDESKLLRQVAGKDYVTLLTCTPKYVNSHRLLVRAERVPTADAGASGGVEERVVSAPPVGIPWWMLITVGPAVIAFFVLRPRRDARSTEA